jgi:hypothetical protein
MRLPGSITKIDGIGSALSGILSPRRNSPGRVGATPNDDPAASSSTAILPTSPRSPLLDDGREMTSSEYDARYPSPRNDRHREEADGHDDEDERRRRRIAAIYAARRRTTIGGGTLDPASTTTYDRPVCAAVDKTKTRDAETGDGTRRTRTPVGVGGGGGGGGRGGGGTLAIAECHDDDDDDGRGMEMEGEGYELEGGPGGYSTVKLGHKFLFLCCDTKRAVVILTSISMLLNSFAFASAMIKYNGSNAEGFVGAMVMLGCGIFVTFCAFLGAFWYSKSVVAVGLLYVAYQLTMDVIRVSKYDWSSSGGDDDDGGKLAVLFPLIVNGLIFYAEAMFISEVNDGIMSRGTYKTRERYSCCCTRW